MRFIFKWDVRPSTCSIGSTIPSPPRNPLRHLRTFTAQQADIVKTFLLLTNDCHVSNLLKPLSSFARWVSFLPATEHQHHSGKFGLLRHSLGVAQRFLKHFRTHQDDRRRLETLPPVERRPWLLAGVLAAVYGSCDKLLDIQVRPVDSGELWDPCAEPLMAYATRWVVWRQKREIDVQFVPGLWRIDDVAKCRSFITHILPGNYPPALIEKMFDIYLAGASLLAMKAPMEQGPAAWFAALLIDEVQKDVDADLARVARPRRIKGGS